MRLLNRLNVGARLGAGFALLLALMVGTIIVGFDQMRLQQASLEEFSGEFRERIHLINLMRDSARYQAIALRDVVAQEDIAFKKGEPTFVPPLVYAEAIAIGAVPFMNASWTSMMSFEPGMVFIANWR